MHMKIGNGWFMMKRSYYNSDDDWGSPYDSMTQETSICILVTFGKPSIFSWQIPSIFSACNLQR